MNKRWRWVLPQQRSKDRQKHLEHRVLRGTLSSRASRTNLTTEFFPWGAGREGEIEAPAERKTCRTANKPEVAALHLTLDILVGMQRTPTPSRVLPLALSPAKFVPHVST